MNIFKQTLIYNICHMISCAYRYIKDKRLIGKLFYSDLFDNIIRKYLSIHLKTDWIGRRYGIINPLVDINGNIDINNVIVELDDENTNNNEYVKIWIIKQLNLVGNLFKIHGLYDYIDINITHVGPINIDNYLVVFDIVNRKLFMKSLKRVISQTLLYSILGILGYLIYSYFMF